MAEQRILDPGFRPTVQVQFIVAEAVDVVGRVRAQKLDVFGAHFLAVSRHLAQRLHHVHSVLQDHGRCDQVIVA